MKAIVEKVQYDTHTEYLNTTQIQTCCVCKNAKQTKIQVCCVCKNKITQIQMCRYVEKTNGAKHTTAASSDKWT